MSNFWQGLSQREKLFVTGGATIIGFFVVIQFMVFPLVDWRSDSKRSIARAENLYQLAAQASASSGTASTANADLSTPVRNVVSSSASRRSIVLDFVNLREDGSVEVTIGDTPTEALFEWFVDLEKNFGVALASADVSRNPEQAGMANARLVFVRLGG